MQTEQEIFSSTFLDRRVPESVGPAQVRERDYNKQKPHSSNREEIPQMFWFLPCYLGMAYLAVASKMKAH
jgi:hypothetical protein